MAEPAIETLLAEQLAYYRARAPEYLKDVLDLPGGQEAEAALEDFAATGDVLELACGPGVWTAQLLRHADSVTAVDAASEMLDIARHRVRDARVRFVLAERCLTRRTSSRRGSSGSGGTSRSRLRQARSSGARVAAHDVLAE